jgi:hypothetical protein
MNAEDSLRNRRRANIRRLLVDKVICPAGGEPFGAVVEACWVCGVHHNTVTGGGAAPVGFRTC